MKAKAAFGYRVAALIPKHLASTLCASTPAPPALPTNPTEALRAQIQAVKDAAEKQEAALKERKEKLEKEAQDGPQTVLIDKITAFQAASNLSFAKEQTAEQEKEVDVADIVDEYSKTGNTLIKFTQLCIQHENQINLERTKNQLAALTAASNTMGIQLPAKSTGIGIGGSHHD